MLIKNSALVLVLARRVTSSSMASGGFMSSRTRRRMLTRRIFLGVHQHFFAARAALVDVDRRPDALIDQLAVETISRLPVPLNSSKITSSILLPVSTRAVARIVSEPPSSTLRAEPKNRLGCCRALASRPPERILPDCGHSRVPGPGQPRDRVEEDDHVDAVLDHPLGLFQHHVGDLHVAGGRLVERAADDFAVAAFDLPLHVGHFFGPLVDQQHDHVDSG